LEGNSVKARKSGKKRGAKGTAKNSVIPDRSQLPIRAKGKTGKRGEGAALTKNRKNLDIRQKGKVFGLKRGKAGCLEKKRVHEKEGGGGGRGRNRPENRARNCGADELYPMRQKGAAEK